MRASLHRKISWLVVGGVRVLAVALSALSAPEKPVPGGTPARITVFGGER